MNEWMNESINQSINQSISLMISQIKNWLIFKFTIFQSINNPWIKRFLIGTKQTKTFKMTRNANVSYLPPPPPSLYLWINTLRYKSIKCRLSSSISKIHKCFRNLVSRTSKRIPLLCSEFQDQALISIIPLRYPVVVKPCMNNFDLWIKHWSSNFQVPKLNIQINRSRFRISDSACHKSLEVQYQNPFSNQSIIIIPVEPL